MPSTPMIRPESHAHHEQSVEAEGFHGLSSNVACCKCRGGLKSATSFRYYAEPLVSGSGPEALSVRAVGQLPEPVPAVGVVRGFPLPRTGPLGCRGP